ncbi:hypothetical protein CBW22_14955 [Pantoea sp. VS1]|nr:hypothetical protein CBW22_14955 [Pantoea sp. VS1]
MRKNPFYLPENILSNIFIAFTGMSNTFLSHATEIAKSSLFSKYRTGLKIKPVHFHNVGFIFSRIVNCRIFIAINDNPLSLGCYRTSTTLEKNIIQD